MSKFALARYNDDGTLDTGFGDGGTRAYEVLPGGNYGAALGIQTVQSSPTAARRIA